MTSWGGMVRRSNSSKEVRKENIEAEEHMNDVEKALYRRGKSLPHKGQFYINNVGTLIEILGSKEKLSFIKDNESLLLTIKYAVWDDEITERRIEYVNVEDDIDDFYFNFKEDVKIRFEEDFEEYGEDILSEYASNWKKCYLPILKVYVRDKSWTSKCDTVFDDLLYSEALIEEAKNYLDGYLGCKYFDYDEVSWCDDECYWDDSYNCWVGFSADIIFKDIEY